MKNGTLLIVAAVIAFSLFTVQSCKDDKDAPTNQEPTCSITNPSFGEEITQGETITVSVEAEDEDDNLKEVRFYIDGIGVGSSTSFPYNYEWETGGVSEGSHTIRAVARDEEQAEAQDEVDVNVVIAGEAPVAAFSADNTTVEEGASIQFTDESTGEPTEWSWDFGDGNTSTVQNPSHTYSSEGVYTVELTAENEYGSDTETKTNYIEVSSSGPGTFTDPRDGQTYQTIGIGSQVWFAENLNYETANSWWYANDPGNGASYGRLYTWGAAVTACPDGWHLPSDEEWKTLEVELGMSQSEADDTGWRGTDQGEQMKSTSGWVNNGNGNNSSGFNALPGGYRTSISTYSDIGYSGLWWSSTVAAAPDYWYRFLDYNRGLAGRGDSYQNNGLSVRCLKD